MSQSRTPVLWLINQYAYSPHDSAGTRHFIFAKALCDAGYDVRVISSSYYHKGRRQRHLVEGKPWKKTSEAGVPFLWVRVPGYQGNVKRLWNMAVFGLRILTRPLERELPQPDFIMATSPSPIAAIMAWKLARRFKAKFVLEVVDIWPQTLMDVGGMSKFHPVYLAFRWIEKFLMRKSDVIMTHLSRAHLHFISLGANKEKCHYVPSPVVVEDKDFIPDKGPERGEPFSFIHAGSLSASYQPEQLIDAMVILKKSHKNIAEKLKINFIGEGPLLSKMETRVDGEGLKDCILFSGVVPKQKVISILRQANAFLVLAKDLKIHEFGISFNKIFDYMIAGRPAVVATNDRETPIMKAHSGVWVPPEDPAALAQAIWQIASMPLSERIEMAQRGYNYVQNNHSIEAWVDTVSKEILIDST